MQFPCRLDKFISHVQELPRSKAKIGIKKGLAQINGELIKKFDHPVQQHDHVTWQGQSAQYLGKRYFMLNKPQGFVCANHDELHSTVFDLLNEPNLADFHIAGRLDIDTTGLVLISNDGQWNHQLTSPKKQKYKTYLVELSEPIDEQGALQLRQGVQLHNERELTLPAKVEILAPYQIRLHICEGKYHQVKRMLAAIGNKVVELHREAIGDITLDNNLQAGEYRQLSEAEIKL